MSRVVLRPTRALPVALAVVGLATLTACGGSDDAARSSSTPPPATSSTTRAGTTTPSSTTSSTSTSTKPSTTSTSATPTNRTVRSGVPNRLEMPSLSFDQPVRALGLTNGAINPPPHVVQWYTGSARPGTRGIAVIAGHVGAYAGRAGIFSPLPRLSVGDRITIGYSGGGEQTFRVYDKAAVGKKALQRDARVWGRSSKPVVALITCDSGAPSVGGHSVRNYVVWAGPV